MIVTDLGLVDDQARMVGIMQRIQNRFRRKTTNLGKKLDKDPQQGELME